MNKVIINYYLDLPSAIQKDYEYIEDTAIVCAPNDTVKKYIPNQIKFLLGDQEYSVDKKDYIIENGNVYKIIYLQHSKHIIDIKRISDKSTAIRGGSDAEVHPAFT